MIINQKLLSLGKMARGSTSNSNNPIYFTKPLEKIIIHWIGAYPNQKVNDPWDWWENGSDGKGIRASAHFIIKDETILQCIPLNEIAWHSGDDRNYNSIGIEVIPMNMDGEFSKTTIDTLRVLIQYIRDRTHLQLKLERHYDGIQKKDCPLFYTPLSNVITKDSNNINLNGQDRWKYLGLFLNDWNRNLTN